MKLRVLGSYRNYSLWHCGRGAAVREALFRIESTPRLHRRASRAWNRSFGIASRLLRNTVSLYSIVVHADTVGMSSHLFIFRHTQFGVMTKSTNRVHQIVQFHCGISLLAAEAKHRVRRLNNRKHLTHCFQ